MAATTEVPSTKLLIEGSVRMQDHQFVKQLTAIFCDGLFSYTEEATAASIIEKSLQLCDGSRDTLSDIVQTKFFAKHSPFFLTIANRRADGGLNPLVSRKTVPPLLSELFNLCGELKEEIQEEIMQALYVHSESELFDALKVHLPLFDRQRPQSFFHNDEEQPSLRATTLGPDGFTISIKIPRFYHRILIDKEVAFQFLAIGSLWTLLALPVEEGGPQGEILAWKFELRETHSKHTYTGRPIQRSINVSMKPAYGSAYTETFVTKCTPVPSLATMGLRGAMSQFHSNPLIAGANRELSGQIKVDDSQVASVWRTRES